MAKFLQETISESGLRAEKVVNSDEFKEFFRKVRYVHVPGVVDGPCDSAETQGQG